MYLTEEDLQAISDLLDKKMEVKFEEKLRPLKEDIAYLKNSVDNLNVWVDRNTRRLEELDVDVRSLKLTCKRNFHKLQDGMDTVEEILKMNHLISG